MALPAEEPPKLAWDPIVWPQIHNSSSLTNNSLDTESRGGDAARLEGELV